MTYKVKNIQYRIQLDTDKNIFIVFDAKNESKTATGHTIEEAIAHLKQLNKGVTNISMQDPLGSYLS